MILSWVISCNCKTTRLATKLSGSKTLHDMVSAHAHAIGEHLIPDLPHQNERDDSNEGTLRCLYPSEISQNDDDHQRELPR